MSGAPEIPPNPRYPVWMVMGAAVFGTLLGGAAVLFGAAPEVLTGESREVQTTLKPVVDSRATEPGAESAPLPTDATERTGLVDAVAKIRNSVVCLKAGERLQGAGAVYDSSGTVLTNFHVVEPLLRATGVSGRGRERSAITVRFANGRELPAKVVITSAGEDIAVLKLQPADTHETFEFSSVGRSSDLAVGEDVFAVGCPVGLSHTVSTGIVSALNRTEVLANRQLPVIQLDAAINLGDSGGPLFNTRSEIVGITTARSRQAEGIGFAIPIDRVMALMRAFRRGDSSRASQISAWLDPNADPSSRIEPLGYKTGLTVSEVMEGPAKRAGLRAGDVIVEVRGTRYDELGSGKRARDAILRRFVELVRSLIPGERLPLRIVRDTEVIELEIAVVAASRGTQGRFDSEALLGLQLSEKTDTPTVEHIAPKSTVRKYPGARKLLGAQITHILGRPVPTVEALGAVLEQVKKWASGRRGRLTVAIDFRDKTGRRWQVEAFPLSVTE